MTIYLILAAILGGLGFNWISNKSRGKNARAAFRYASWGSWLSLLCFFAHWLPFPLIWPLNIILMLTPTAICLYLAAASMLKEMRAQKVGAYTERA